MFPQEHRLGRTAFAQVYKRGRRTHTAGLTLIWRAAPFYKAAVVVGKKVAKNAVERNRLRRRLYAVLREANLQSGHIIVIAKPPLRAYSYARMGAELTAGLGRLVGLMALSR